MSSHTTIEQRIYDFKALCVSSGLKYKEVIVEAGLGYDSVINNWRTNSISNERMTLLEDTALRLRSERKLQPQT